MTDAAWQEKWEELERFPRYLVSNQGRVKTKATGLIRYGSPNPNGSGLRMGLIRDDGKVVFFYIHRLVAEVFLPDWDKTFNVGFRDGNNQHCEVWNLVMLTTGFGIPK